MEGLTAIVLFDLALVVPPLTVLAGIVMLALPSRSRHAESPAPAARAA
jgi:hypothetical protein